MFKCCTLCPRMCRVDRTNRLGKCKSSDTLKVARAALHFWEEPCISGENGSGTVFFSGCQLGCVYCQNRNISDGKAGKEITPERLCEIFLELQQKGALNINLVTPDHFVPHIITALHGARKNGLILPVIYNTGGYCSVDTLKMLSGVVDVYLPDFKYMSPEISKKYSSAADYSDVAKKALSEMVLQQPEIVFDENGIIRRGVIVRHMQLPGYLNDSKSVVKYLHETYGDKIYMSLMSQYTPLENVKNHPEISRRVTTREYDRLVDYAISLGVQNAYVQEGKAASESFIPEFDCEGV